MMDVIKKETEVDPLAILTSDNSDTNEKKPLSQPAVNWKSITPKLAYSDSAEGKLLDLDVAGIKTECLDHSYDLKSEIKVEEPAVSTNFCMPKCKNEAELCDLGTVKDEPRLEFKAEDNEILTDR
ncbi:uncharacterized protein [Periplaneta americana]|uniref:uncharacterized protein isoform X4 n=1 Tax=Periplaneta americana TaxID=6978 RepID=UPI0037E780E0